MHENEGQRLARSTSMAEIPSVTIIYYAPLAQLDRASASDAEGQRFESSRARHFSTTYADRPFPENTDCIVIV